MIYISSLVIDSKAVIAEATAEAAGVARNVLVLARLTGATPKALATAIVNEVEAGKFLTKFTSELVEARMAEAIENANSNTD